MIFLWFLSWFSWWMISENKEATEPRIHFGQVEVNNSKVLWSPQCLGSLFRNICHKWPLIYVPVCPNDKSVLSSLGNYNRVCNRVTQWVTLVCQDLLNHSGATLVSVIIFCSFLHNALYIIIPSVLYCFGNSIVCPLLFW